LTVTDSQCEKFNCSITSVVCQECNIYVVICSFDNTSHKSHLSDFLYNVVLLQFCSSVVFFIQKHPKDCEMKRVPYLALVLLVIKIHKLMFFCLNQMFTMACHNNCVFWNRMIVWKITS